VKSIKADPTPFEARVKDSEKHVASYPQLTRRGNLLLFVDRPAEARDAFERALKLANEAQRAAAIENVARAIRAEDGAVGRANAYILSLRGDAAPAAAPE
jgi:hypothetical protein